MPALSQAALALFRTHVDRQGDVAVDDSNRQAYRELETAGLVLLSRPYAGPRAYRLTREGFERKAELLACSKEAG